MSVNHAGKEYSMMENRGLLTLNLSGEGIKDITEINGLEALTELQVLNLSKNRITEIKGLEPLKNLIKLDLSSNLIAEIKGLRNLTNLKKLNLKENRFINIKGFENLININKIKFGFAHWDAANLKPADYALGARPRKTLLLNGNELTVVEKSVVRGDSKKVVAYCRARLKLAGYSKSLVPADSKIEKFEKQIIKMIKKNEKKIQKAVRKLEMAKKQKFNYDNIQMTR